MKTLDQFIADNKGKAVERVDANSYAQCVDLAIYWCENLGLPITIFSGVYNAFEIFTSPNSLMKEKFNFIANTPTNSPQAGDVLVFGKAVGPNGHVSIVKEADASKIVSFDQNWSNHPYCELVTHNYTGVLGWLRLKTSVTPSNSPVEAPEKIRAVYWDRLLTLGAELKLWKSPAHEDNTDVNVLKAIRQLYIDKQLANDLLKDNEMSYKNTIMAKDEAYRLYSEGTERTVSRLEKEVLYKEKKIKELTNKPSDNALVNELNRKIKQLTVANAGLQVKLDTFTGETPLQYIIRRFFKK